MELRDSLELSTWRHAAGTLKPWVRVVLALACIATERGGKRDDDGIVEFVAAGVTRGKPFRQHERSRFRRSTDGAVIEVRDIRIETPFRAHGAAELRHDPGFYRVSIAWLTEGARAFQASGRGAGPAGRRCR